MQFHLNGFRPGDPDIRTPFAGATAGSGSADIPKSVDVLIVGTGPAGLTLAAQLSAFPGIKTCIVEQKAGPLQLGQADGVACRTVEMFQAFGFAGRVLRESYWVNETVFWRPAAHDPARIERSGRVADTEEGLSEFPHVILNQARVHDFYLDVMRKSPTRLEPHYGRRLLDVTIEDETESDGAPPVVVRLERQSDTGNAAIETVRARYVVGCDGARSTVRKAIGRELRGDSANQVWGVMDVLAVSDFPDIRLKSLVQSADHGSILIIPREGGYLVRIYVELDKLDATERIKNRNITIERLIAAVQKIVRPYTFDVKEVAWWSAYEIGQRLCDRFDNASDGESQTPCIFIAGDACHTHSPKAGQGMNVSMQDSLNLGWKLAAVIHGQSPPVLLKTYSEERQAVARELIEFDREWAAMLSSAAKSHGDAESHGGEGADGVDPAVVQDYFVKHGRYTAGTATHYRPSILTAEGAHQHLARGYVIGTRFHSAPVVRLADARPCELGHVIEADGRWRIFAFASSDDPAAADSGIRALCDFLANAPNSPLIRHTTAGTDIDAIIDVRAIFQQSHRTMALQDMPALLLPLKGRYGLRDYEKMFCPAPGDRDIFDMRGIARQHGCMVVVRPDQYVANVLPLDGFEELSAFFAGFMTGPERR